MSGALHQVDYAAAGIFLNISSDGGRGSAPWWTRDDLQVAPGIEADVPVSSAPSQAVQCRLYMRSCPAQMQRMVCGLAAVHVCAKSSGMFGGHAAAGVAGQREKPMFLIQSLAPDPQCSHCT